MLPDMGSNGNEKLFPKLPSLASAFTQRCEKSENLADSCYNRFHETHKLCTFNREPGRLLGNSSFSSAEDFLTTNNTPRELFYRAGLECQRTRLPKVELAIGLADIDATEFPPIATKSSRGFRGVLPLDASHVKAATKRKSIALRVYGDQLPLAQRDLKVVKSEKTFSGEKRTATCSGQTHRSVPSLAPQVIAPRGNGLGKFPYENQSFVDLCRKSSAFTPRIPMGNIAFRHSATSFQALTPQSSAQLGIPRTCSVKSRTEQTVTLPHISSLPHVTVESLLKDPKYQTQDNATHRKGQKKVKRTPLTGFFAPKVPQKDCQIVQEQETPFPMVTPPTKKISLPKITSEDQRPTPTPPSAEERSPSTGTSTDYVTADDVDQIFPDDDDTNIVEPTLVEKPSDSNTNYTSCESFGSLPSVQVKDELPSILHDVTALSGGTTPATGHDEVTSLPPLTSHVDFREKSASHDADDEGDSERYENLKYRCPASRDQKRSHVTESRTPPEGAATSSVVETAEHDGAYKRFARSKRKIVKTRRKLRSPHEVASESSTNLSELAQKKKKSRKKGRKKKKVSQSEENLPSRTRGLRKTYDSDPLDGDNEQDENDD